MRVDFAEAVYYVLAGFAIGLTLGAFLCRS